MAVMSKLEDVEVPEIKIRSKSYEELLNTIDQLRSQGLNNYVSLPQLIVCGDQSSGKSSVLEAVSGIRFPSADDTCTRFATELVLQRSPLTSSSVSIVPDIKRPNEEQEKLRQFTTNLSISNEFPKIVEEAKKLMGITDIGSHGTKIGTDRLRIEITGPGQPHLTLVDLPGLIHAAGPTLTENDVEAAKSLVIEYMKTPRSVILAVITAKNDFSNQAVTAYAKKYDPKLTRTLGIITKPDDLPEDSSRLRTFRALVENKSEKLKLGWHVLKNREHGQENFTSVERDRSEEEFFNKNSWKSLNPNLKGVTSLRPRLSKVLQGQILTELPNLMQDVQNGIRECEMTLEKLGAPRKDKQEQLMYLHSVSEMFTKLVKCAADGHYEDEYFDNASTERGYAKRMRAVVVSSLDQFAMDLQLRGHKTETIEESSLGQNSTTCKENDNKTATSRGTPDSQRAKRNYSQFLSAQKTRSERFEDVSQLIRRNRGRELPCFMKAETITQLFRDQCAPWKQLVGDYANDIFEEARNSLYLALEASADPVTQEGILRVIINPALEDIKKDLNKKVQELLKQHLYGVPITFNHYLTENIQKLRQQHNSEFLSKQIAAYLGTNPSDKELLPYSNTGINITQFANSLAASYEADMNNFASSEALHFMEAYYKVALKFITDDFAIHAIEECLMSKLPAIFDLATVLTLDEKTIEDIAGETEESQAERTSSMNKLKVLKVALSTLYRFSRGSARN